MVDQVAEDPDRRSASRRVADALRAEIESGQYLAGAPLPTYRQLANDHEVAVNTAMAAVRLLRDEGLVTSRQNAGNYVRDRAGDVDTEAELRSLRVELADLQTQVRSAGASLAAVESRIAVVADRLAALEI